MLSRKPTKKLIGLLKFTKRLAYRKNPTVVMPQYSTMRTATIANEAGVTPDGILVAELVHGIDAQVCGHHVQSLGKVSVHRVRRVGKVSTEELAHYGPAFEVSRRNARGRIRRRGVRR